MFLIIVLAAILGGGAFGTLMIVGTMLYAGKWSLPGTRQREIQAAQVRSRVAELDAVAQEHRNRTQELSLLGDVQREQLFAQLSALRDASFQKELGKGQEQ